MVCRWINVTIMTLGQRHSLDVYATNKSRPISTLIQRHGLMLDQRHIYDVGSMSQLSRHNLDVYPTNKSNQISTLIQRHGLIGPSFSALLCAIRLAMCQITLSINLSWHSTIYLSVCIG